MKRVWNIISTVIVALMVLCAVFLMGSRVIGYQCYTVISGSMEPTYSVGDLLYVKKASFDSIQVGDPITFLLNEDLVVATHRVVSVDKENLEFTTKGDANDVEDQNPVHYNNVIGVPQFSIPLLGYVANYVQNPPGTYVTIGIGIILILIVFLPDMIGKKKEGEETDEQTEAVKAEIDATAEENEKLKAELEKLRQEMSEKKSEE